LFTKYSGKEWVRTFLVYSDDIIVTRNDEKRMKNRNGDESRNLN